MIGKIGHWCWIVMFWTVCAFVGFFTPTLAFVLGFGYLAFRIREIIRNVMAGRSKISA